jgi:Domain of unknown function (DUF4280)
MGIQTAMSATMMCSFGAAPSTLIVVDPRVMTENKLAANIMDNKPIANIPPFGVCSSLANPTVASATAAALGVLTPMPCVPVIAAPWAPGSPTVMERGMPALNNSSKCMCNWAGVISITVPGATTVMVP